MTRSIYPRTPRCWVTSGVASKAKGGTSGQDTQNAVSNLGGIYSPLLDSASYVPKLTSLGKVNPLQLPDMVVVGSMLIGPSFLYPTQVASYQISNYDSLTEYGIILSSGSWSRVNDIITITAPDMVTTLVMTINGRTIPIVIKEPWPLKPTLSVSTSGTNTSATGVLTSSAFAMITGNLTHLRTDWQIAYDSDFTTFALSDLNDHFNKLTWTALPLNLNTTYHARCRHEASNGVLSDWSDTVAFTTRAKYTPNLEEYKGAASNKTSNSNFGFAVDIDDTGTRVVVGAPYAANGTTAGKYGIGYIFVRSGTTWTQEGKTAVAGISDQGIYLGYSVSINGDGTRCVFGAPFDTVSSKTKCGSVVTYVRSGTTWTKEFTLSASDGAANDNFGTAVTISSDSSRIIVGSPLSDPNNVSSAGAVYVFVYQFSWYYLEAKLIGPGASIANDLFGAAVAVDSTGTRVLIGAYGADPNSLSAAGVAYVFARSGTTWAWEATVSAFDKKANDQFGIAVDIDNTGTRLVVSANKSSAGGKTSAGAVYVFIRNGTNWILEAKLEASDKLASDQFGYSVGISGNGDKVVVGANLSDPGGTSAAGAAYIYNRVNSIWTQEAKVIASDKAANDNFGNAIEISADGTRMIVGSYLEDPGGTSNAGSIYIYS